MDEDEDEDDDLIINFFGVVPPKPRSQVSTFFISKLVCYITFVATRRNNHLLPRPELGITHKRIFVIY